MPDGSVQIPVGLNFNTAIKDAKQLGNELKNIFSKIDMGNLDSKSLSFLKNLTNLTNRMEKLAEEAERLANTKIPTEDYVQLTKQVDKARNAIERLENRQDELNTSRKSLTDQRASVKAQILEQENIIAELTDTKKFAEKNRNDSTGQENFFTQQRKLEEATENLEKARSKLRELKSEYESLGGAINSVGRKQEAVTKQIEMARRMERDAMTDMQSLEEEGGAFTSGKDTAEYKNKINTLMQTVQAANILKEKYNELHEAELAEAEQNVATNRAEEIDETSESMEQLDLTIGEEVELAEEASQVEEEHTDKLEKLKNVAHGVASTMSRTARATASMARAFMRMINPLSLLSKHSRDSGRHTDNFGKSMKRSLMTLLKYTLGIRSLYFLFRRLRGVAKEAIKVMVQEIPEMNKAVSDIVTAFKGLKASVGTLVQPFIQMFAPAITLAIQKITELMNKMAQLFAMMAGQNYIYEASVDYVDYAKSVEEASGSLASFDKLNVVGSGEKNGTGLTKDTVHYAKKYFDTVALADNAIVKTLKNALKLVKDIGTSFKKAWENGAGEKILKNIQRRFENILRFVNGLITAFDKAWNTAGIGDGIAETLLGLFEDISGFVADITGDLAEWAEDLDLAPLLESAKKVLEKVREMLQPVFKFLRKIWKDILLPLGKWLVENLLPVLSDLASSVFDKIVKFLEWVEPKLEWLINNVIKPIAETLGEALLDIIKDIQEFLDGEFSETLDSVFDFLDEIVMPLLEYLFGFLTILLKGAIRGIVNVIKTAIDTLKNLFTNVKDVLNGVVDFIKGVFSGDLELALEGCKKIFQGTMNAIISIIEGVINGMIDAVNVFAGLIGQEFDNIHIKRWGETDAEYEEAVRKKKKSQLDYGPEAYAAAAEALGKPVEEVTQEEARKYQFELFKKKHANSGNIVRQRLSNLKVPHAAAGMVLPPNNPFLAVVGDQTNGTNVETPLSTIEQAVANVMSTMGIKVTFDVKGDPNGLFKAVQKKAEIYTLQHHGKSAF